MLGRKILSTRKQRKRSRQNMKRIKTTTTNNTRSMSTASTFLSGILFLLYQDLGTFACFQVDASSLFHFLPAIYLQSNRKRLCVQTYYMCNI